MAELSWSERGGYTRLKHLPITQSSAAANAAKHAAKRARHAHSGLTPVGESFHPRATATGSISLIDAGGVKHFIDTNITLSPSSSASTATSEAIYTVPIVASTEAGGTANATLIDNFNGHNPISVNPTNHTGPLP